MNMVHQKSIVKPMSRSNRCKLEDELKNSKNIVDVVQIGVKVENKPKEVGMNTLRTTKYEFACTYLLMKIPAVKKQRKPW